MIGGVFVGLPLLWREVMLEVGGVVVVVVVVVFIGIVLMICI